MSNAHTGHAYIGGPSSFSLVPKEIEASWTGFKMAISHGDVPLGIPHSSVLVGEAVGLVPFGRVGASIVPNNTAVGRYLGYGTWAGGHLGGLYLVSEEFIQD